MYMASIKKILSELDQNAGWPQGHYQKISITNLTKSILWLNYEQNWKKCDACQISFVRRFIGENAAHYSLYVLIYLF